MKRKKSKNVFRVEALRLGEWHPAMSRDWDTEADAKNALDSLRIAGLRGTYRVTIVKQEETR